MFSVSMSTGLQLKVGGADYLMSIYQPPRNCPTRPTSALLPSLRYSRMLPLSKASRSLVARRAAFRKPHHLPTLALVSRRTYVQPSGADRASVVDVPSAFQDESHFAPRTGESLPLIPSPTHKTNLIFHRYARLQVGASTAGRWAYQEDSPNLPRHAGDRSRVIFYVAF
jgi:hypothetical protein